LIVIAILAISDIFDADRALLSQFHRPLIFTPRRAVIPASHAIDCRIYYWFVALIISELFSYFQIIQVDSHFLHCIARPSLILLRLAFSPATLLNIFLSVSLYLFRFSAFRSFTKHFTSLFHRFSPGHTYIDSFSSRQSVSQHLRFLRDIIAAWRLPLRPSGRPYARREGDAFSICFAFPSRCTEAFSSP